MFELVFQPASQRQQRIPFTVSEGDLDDAIDVGRVEADEPFEKQLHGCAYHMVLEGNVGVDHERIAGEPWVLLHKGSIIARNHLAMSVRDEDLA